MPQKGFHAVTHRMVPALAVLVTVLLGTSIEVPGSVLAADEQASAGAAAKTAQKSNPSVAVPLLRPPAISFVNEAEAVASGVSAAVLDLATRAVTCAVNSGDISAPPTLTLIDYSRPSTEPRLWVFDLRTGRLRFRELVAHGKGTGENLAEHFSDEMNSHQSSLGLFVTGDTYTGSNGYSLRLDGLEPGFNGRARERAIVMHGASYVDAAFAARQGRLGRSWGCPALSQAIARQVIDFVRDGGVVFSYYPDETWLRESRFLNCPAATPDTTLAGAGEDTPLVAAGTR